MFVVKMTLISRTNVAKITSHVRRVCKYFGRVDGGVSVCHLGLSKANSESVKFTAHTKSFHVLCTVYAKLYVEVENTYAHAWMEKSSSYSPTICKQLELKEELTHKDLENVLLQDWSCRSAKEIFVAFRDISFICKDNSLNITDPQLKNLCAAVSQKCVDFEDQQLLTSLRCLSLWPPTDSIRDEPYYTLWKALDKVCLNRLKGWDSDMALLVADHWYVLNLARRSEYVKQCLRRLARKLDRLTLQQFVQLMFYINLCRKLPPSASKFEFTYALENICDKLSLEELAIASMGFFKTQTQIKNPHIGEVLLSRIESCLHIGDSSPPDSIAFASLIKMARYCVSPTSHAQMQRALDAMLPHLKNLSLLGCLHVALMGTNIQLFHEPVTKAVCSRYAMEMEKARLKDIERLALVLTLYNYDPKTEPCIYDAMVAEVRRRMAEAEEEGRTWYEMEKHGECLLRFLGYLSLRDIFPLDIIEKAMDPEFFKHVYGKSWNKVGREVLILDVNLEVRCPHYQKNRLDPKLRAYLINKYQHAFPKVMERKKMTAANRLHFEVLETIQAFPGAEGKVTSAWILPQFERADIVFCADGNKVFQNVTLPRKNTSLLKCPSNLGQWHSVVPAGWNVFTKSTNQPLGPLACHLKQLEALGYKPTLIPWFEWDAVRIEERPKYLRRKIFN